MIKKKTLIRRVFESAKSNCLPLGWRTGECSREYAILYLFDTDKNPLIAVKVRENKVQVTSYLEDIPDHVQEFNPKTPSKNYNALDTLLTSTFWKVCDIC